MDSAVSRSQTWADAGATNETNATSGIICDGFTNAPLYSVILSALGLDDSEPLTPEALTKVVQLSLDLKRSPSKVTSFTGIQCLTALTHLSISGGEVADLSPLSALALEELYIGQSLAPNLTTLTGVAASSLSTLKVSESAVEDLSGAENLSTLRILELRDNAIQDVSILAELNQLQELRLDGNRLREVAALASLPNLQRLSLDGNELTTLASLDAHPKLTSITVTGNRITSLAGLDLPSLFELDVSDNTLEEMGDLSRMPALLWFNASNNELITIDGIESLQRLERLDLSGNPIANVSSLAPLTSMQRLSMNDTAVEDLTPVGQLTALSALDLWNIPATDLSPLLALADRQSTACRELRVSQSQLDEQSLEEVIPMMCEGGWQVDGDAGQICQADGCDDF